MSKHSGVLQRAALKNHMRYASRPFSGEGYPFNRALREVRAEGVVIRYHRATGSYYNPKYLDPFWYTKLGIDPQPSSTSDASKHENDAP